MLTLLATALGLLGNVLPNILSIWSKYIDAKNQRDLLELQAKLDLEKAQFQALVEQNKAIFADRESARNADNSSSGFWFWDAMHASIRPILTYCIIFLFFGTKFISIYFMTQSGIQWEVAAQSVLDTETTQFFTSLFGFYFGQTAGNLLISKK